MELNRNDQLVIIELNNESCFAFSGTEATLSFLNFSGTVLQRNINLEVSVRVPPDCTGRDARNCRQLEKLLVELSSPGSFIWKTRRNGKKERVWNLSLEFGVTEEERNFVGDDAVLMQPNEAGGDDQEKEFRGYMKIKGTVLSVLRELSAGEAKAVVELACFTEDDDESILPYYTQSMRMEIFKGANENFCQDHNVGFPKQQRNSVFDWKRDTVTGTCIIKVAVPLEALKKDNKQVKTKLLNRNVLENGIFSDITIVPSNGTRIKAHRRYLGTHSSKFAAILQQIAPSQDNELDMTEMTEEGVRALLKYLYFEDQHDMIMNRQILIEVFQASYKYDITALKCLTKAMVIEMPNSSIGVDEAVNFFKFVHQLVPADADLLTKATSLLSENSFKLNDSQAYQELRHENPSLAGYIGNLSSNKTKQV